VSEAFIIKVFGWWLGRLLDLYEDFATASRMSAGITERLSMKLNCDWSWYTMCKSANSDELSHARAETIMKRQIRSSPYHPATAVHTLHKLHETQAYKISRMEDNIPSVRAKHIGKRETSDRSSDGRQ